MATVIITSNVMHDMSTLHAFGVYDASAVGNSGFSTVKEFESLEKAKEFLTDIATEYFDGDELEVARRLTNGGARLDIDNVSARIEE